MSIEDLFEYVIMIAVTVIIILLLTQRFLDISVIRQGADQSRATSNALQAIVTSSPLLMTDNVGNLERLMFKSGATNSNSQPLQKCCGLLDYDYKFQVGNLAPVFNFAVPTGSQSFIFGIGQQGANAAPISACYSSYDLGNVVTTSTIADVCDANGLCTPTTAVLTTAQTPLSELAFWISAECQDTTSGSFEKLTPLDVNDVVPCSGGTSTNCGIEIDGNTQQICINTQHAGEPTGKYCKNFVCNQPVSLVPASGSDIGVVQQQTVISQQLGVYSCFYAMVKKTPNSLSVVVPQNYIGTYTPPASNQQTLPANQDTWTEGTAYAYSINPQYGSVTPTNDKTDVYKGLQSVLFPQVTFETAVPATITLDLTKIQGGSIDLTNYNHIKFAFEASNVNLPQQYTKVTGLYITATLVSGSQSCIVDGTRFTYGSWQLLDFAFSTGQNANTCPSNFPMNDVTSIQWGVSLLCQDESGGLPEMCNVDLHLDNLYFYQGAS